MRRTCFFCEAEVPIPMAFPICGACQGALAAPEPRA